MEEQSPIARALVESDIQDPAQGIHAYLWHEHRAKFVTALSVSTAICGGLLALEWAGTGSLPALAANGGQALLVPFIVFLWPASIYVSARIRLRHQFLERVAGALGLAYAPTADARSVTSRLLSVGHSQRMTDVMSGMYEGHSLRIYDFARTIGYGKGSHTDFYTVFELSFDKNLPEIGLYARGTDIFGLDSTGSSADGQAVQLEGDFGQYFVLRAPKDYEMETRVIFQPDLMALLVDRFKQFDIELFQNKLYLFRAPLSTKEEFSRMYDLADALYDKLAPLVREVGSATPIPTPKPLLPILSETQL